MATKTLIVSIILLIVGLIIFGSLLEPAGWAIHGNTVSNNSITFTNNNTYYGTARSPILAITGLYNDSDHNGTYATALYDFDPIMGIRIYVNDSADPTGDPDRHPNMTSGNTYYATYTIVKPSGFASVIMVLFIGVLALVVILIYLKGT